MTLLVDLTLTLSLKFSLKLLIPEKSNPKVRLTSLTDLLTWPRIQVQTDKNWLSYKSQTSQTIKVKDKNPRQETKTPFKEISDLSHNKKRKSQIKLVLSSLIQEWDK